MTSFDQLFSTYFTIAFLTKKESIKYNLITRYESKISERLKAEKLEMDILSTSRFNEFCLECTLTGKAYLKVKPDNIWQSSPIHFPAGVSIDL